MANCNIKKVIVDSFAIAEQVIKMRTKLLILCYVVLLACGKEERVPEDVLPKEKMVSFLIDIYVAEGKVQNLRVSRDSAIALFEVYEEKLFEEHDIDKDTYVKSMSYYYDHPQKLELIYETVLDSLNLKEQQLKEKKEDDLKSEEDKKKLTKER